MQNQVIWLAEIRSGRGFLIYSAGQGLNAPYLELFFIMHSLLFIVIFKIIWWLLFYVLAC